MAGKNYPEVVGQSYHLADVKSSSQSAINCYPQKVDDSKWVMQSIAGEVPFIDLGAEIRNSKNVDGRWFVVSGGNFYEVYSNGTYVLRGTIFSSTGYVGMAFNKTQLAIVDGEHLYVFTLSTNTLTNITVAGWRGSSDVCELDGYFIFVAPDSDQFYISAIDDGTVLDGLDFSSADSSPDNIVRQLTSHRQLWLFGKNSTEIWIDSGAASFPFVRYNSYTIDVGCVGKRAAIVAADTVFWIGTTDRGTGIVYMAQGNQPQRVSTMAVEQALSKSSDLSQASMWCYQIDGHEFIGINVPGLQTTWVYDAALQQWHERGEWLDNWLPIRSGLVTAFNGEHYAGDAYGKIVRFDNTVNNLSSRPLVRERTWKHITADSLEPIRFAGLELAMRTGYGGNVTLEISNDGGYNYGAKLLRGLGATGRWMQRIRWLNLGTAYNRVYRVRCSDDVPFTIYSASVDT